MPKPAPTNEPVLDLIRERWSPLAFDDRPVPADALRCVFEAARWSPSSSNEQPWRFIVGSKDSDPATYSKILECIVPANQVWASTAPVLMLNLGARDFERNGQPNPYALYDTGQATVYLTLQATALGLGVHQMGGFDRDRARVVFAIPDDYELGAAIALGYEGDPARLSDEKYRERHTNPTRVRKALSDIVLSGAGDTFGTASQLATPAPQKVA